MTGDGTGIGDDSDGHTYPPRGGRGDRAGRDPHEASGEAGHGRREARGHGYDGDDDDDDDYRDDDYRHRDYDDYGDEYDGDEYDEDEDDGELDGMLGERTAPVHRRTGDSGGERGDRAARPSPARRRRAVPALVAVVLVVAVVLGGGIYGVGKLVGRIGGPPADFAGPGEGGVDIQIPQGATSREIARVLVGAGVVASEGAFVEAAAADARALSIQPGYYRLPLRMSARGALDALLDPAANALHRFTITEGMTARQVIEQLSKRTGVAVEEYQKLVDDPAPLGLPDYAATTEGYLFPSTYDLLPDASPADTLKMFVDKFHDEAAALDLENAAPAVGLTPQEVVTVASIIEKEVAHADECPKVARVIYNRLNDNTGRFTRLDMDSTTRYALNNFDGPLTVEQLRTPHPYNTRAVAGLPPGAIANPGLRALEAALRPAQGTWLYFVSLPKSNVTIFATTEAEWEAAQARYRAEGGS